jgi:signal transduction histidine kinase
MTQPLSPTAVPLARAVRLAASAPDADQALEAVLADAVQALGAVGGAVLESDGSACIAAWGCEAADLAPLRDAVLREALAEPGRDGEPVHLYLPTAVGGAGEALLLPLHARGAAVGSLLLLLPGGPPPDPELAAGYAAVASLALDASRLAEEARTARQAQDHFLTALNHELRTPATAFALTADLLHSEPPGELPPRLERLLRDADTYLQQLIGVLRRVLDLGRLGDHANPERDDLLQPREAITEIMRRVEPAAARKQLTLRLYVPRSLPPLQTDGRRVSRILLHLLSNAIKYTTHGSVEVRVERDRETLTRARPEPVLLVRIRDSGCGIPPHEIERIFEPFAQVDEGARTDSFARGQGLGLPLARRLARTLGGDVRLESRLGVGTTATLVLPYHHPEG